MKLIVMFLTTIALGSSALAALTSAQIETLFNKLDDACSGNDNGLVGAFDVATFNPKKAKKKLRKENNGCKRPKMSESKAEGVQLFVDYFRTPRKDDDFSKCVAGALSAKERADVISVVTDPANLSVFASMFQGGDDSEACKFNHFHVYRASGQFINIVHDETD